ncbi:histone-like nucleoid-structuring protein Lsr2 [Streptomyces sp. NPDC020298]|uniref:Lsr2 family DNA-binding protein n=1 Tax=unclassified Streptomyces TaxID=2593676 RepID=UPI0033EA28BE
MTIAALRRLLDEIDHQGGPEAARANCLHLPDEGPTMTAAPEPAIRPAPLVTIRPPAVEEQPEQLPVGKLLKWGDDHEDPAVQDQAARARIALHGLRQRYTSDRELAALATEEQQLEQRLAELRARKGELAPVKPKAKRSSPSYDAAVVRAWARGKGVACPDRGRIPKKVVDAWRADTGTAAS